MKPLGNSPGPLHDFLSVKLTIGAQLLIARADRFTDPSASIIAWLKRVLEIHNQTLTAAAALGEHPNFSADRVTHYRAELFQIREAVLAIIAQLRQAE